MWLKKHNHKIKQILVESGYEYGYDSKTSHKRITSDIGFLPYHDNLPWEIVDVYVHTGLYKTLCKFR